MGKWSKKENNDKEEEEEVGGYKRKNETWQNRITRKQQEGRGERNIHSDNIG